MRRLSDDELKALMDKLLEKWGWTEEEESIALVLRELLEHRGVVMNFGAYPVPPIDAKRS